MSDHSSQLFPAEREGTAQSQIPTPLTFSGIPERVAKEARNLMMRSCSGKLIFIRNSRVLIEGA